MSDYIVALLEHDAVMSEDQWKEVSSCLRSQTILDSAKFVARELLDFLDDRGFSSLVEQSLTFGRGSTIRQHPL